MTKLCVAFLISLCVSITLQLIPRESFGNVTSKEIKKNPLPINKPVKTPELHIKLGVENQFKNSSKHNDAVLSRDAEPNKNKNNYMSSIEPGADLRLLSVIISFVAVTCLLFVGCKIYRNRKMPKIVKKYGERKRRTDVEIAPLPLHEDDEDDETVFDLVNVSTRI